MRDAHTLPPAIYRTLKLTKELLIVGGCAANSYLFLCLANALDDHTVPCRTMVRHLVALACMASIWGCGCADVAFNRVDPAEPTIAVGQSVTLVYSTGGGCRSADGLTDVDLHEAPTIWHTTDTLVVALDTLSGRVTGRSTGTAFVYSGGGSSATVHVH